MTSQTTQAGQGNTSRGLAALDLASMNASDLGSLVRQVAHVATATHLGLQAADVANGIAEASTGRTLS